MSKYKSGEISARKLAVEVASDLKADIACDVVASACAAIPVPQIKGLCIFGKAALSLPRYYAKSKAAINSLSLLSKTMQEAERVISSRQSGGSGGPNLEPEEPEKKENKHRVKRTAEDVIKYFKELKKDKNWQFYRTDGRGHRAYRNRKTG